MLCGHCGAINLDDSLFCNACGKPISPLRQSSAEADVEFVRTDRGAIRVSPSDQAKYSAVYREMSDDELVRLKDQMGTLRDSAKAALLAELRTRNLENIAAPQVVPQSERPQLSGVGGWLAFLVLNLVLGTPIAVAVAIIDGLDMLKSSGGDSSATRLSLGMAVVLGTGLAAWSTYCGVCLLRLKPNAPRITKIYLIAILFVTIIVDVVVPVTGIAKNGGSADVGAAVASSIRDFVGIVVWYAYLATSERVKNTYPSVSQ